MSRLPSSRGSSTATASRSAGAQRGGRPGVFVQAPKSDIYVAMLGVSLAAILIATLLMVLLFSRYSFSTKVTATSTSPALTRMA